MCCNRPRLVRERQVLISEYKREKATTGEEEPQDDKAKQKSLADYSKKK
jgi:hypothetical protein